MLVSVTKAFLLSENYVELKPYPSSIVNPGFVVRNKGCRIPAMDPYDSAITRFILKEKPIVCEHGDHLPLVDSNDTSLFINPDAVSHFYNNSGEIDCCWRPFWRMKDEDNVITLVSLLIRDCIESKIVYTCNGNIHCINHFARHAQFPIAFTVIGLSYACAYLKNSVSIKRYQSHKALNV